MENSIQHYKGMVLIPLVILIALEIIWSWRNDKQVYQVKETITNILILAGFQVSKFLFAGYQLMIMAYAGKWALFSIPENWFTYLIVFFLADFIYYWFHRVSHVFRPLWAFHSVHHSSMHMNLTSAYRLNWFSALITPFFFLPLVVIGFSPQSIVVCYALNLLYQFFLHTEAIGKLGSIEGIMDTPSAHRVHHGCNDNYIDKNFGGVFMIWDRLFKTYQPENEKPVYGLKEGFISNNPIVLVSHEFINLFRKKKQQAG
jgi:sterol desaturase/sphingolipid hydroxylase (fatty acid hydroxylase superfamily)